MDIGRQADIEYLTSQLRGATGMQRKYIEDSIETICNETGMIRSMRERLIKESRAGNTANIRDINEYVMAKQKKRSVGWV
jgi:hypothetical protein